MKVRLKSWEQLEREGCEIFRNRIIDKYGSRLTNYFFNIKKYLGKEVEIKISHHFIFSYEFEKDSRKLIDKCIIDEFISSKEEL